MTPGDRWPSIPPEARAELQRRADELSAQAHAMQPMPSRLRDYDTSPRPRPMLPGGTVLRRRWPLPGDPETGYSYTRTIRAPRPRRRWVGNALMVVGWLAAMIPTAVDDLLRPVGDALYFALVPVGIVTVLAGLALVVTSRRRTQ